MLDLLCAHAQNVEKQYVYVTYRFVIPVYLFDVEYIYGFVMLGGL